jgi:O-antigen ligase
MTALRVLTVALLLATAVHAVDMHADGDTAAVAVWGGFAVVGAAGHELLDRGHPAAARAALALFGLGGVATLAHYAEGTDLDVGQHASIWVDVVLGAALLAAVRAAALSTSPRRGRRRTAAPE